MGSPLVALKAGDKYYPFTDYLLNDLNYSKELEAEIDNFFQKHGSLKTRHKKDDKVEEIEVTRQNVKILSKDGVKMVDEDISKIPETIPCFIFMDPEGISEIPWEATVKPCLQRKKTEVLLLYCTGGVLRCMNDTKSHQRLDDFFGDREWRNLLSVENQREELVEHYISNVKKHKRFVFQTDPINNEKNSEVYRLIFATDNDKAKKIWEKHALHRVNELWKEKEYRDWVNKTFGRSIKEWF
jgi:three-Cys-motif partner protein